MIIPCTLLIFGTKAMNEEQNFVTAKVVKDYLSSPRWAKQKAARNISVSVTHYLRNDAGSEPGLGASDKLFKDGTIIGCLDDCWISKDGKSWEGQLDIYDDLSEYSESQKSQIQQVLRLIKHKVSIQLSLCIEGEWSDSDGGLEFLYELQGCDLTLNGAFNGAQLHPKDMED